MRSAKSRGGLISRGMSEYVRNLWVLSLNISAKIHSSLMEVIGCETTTNQQVELRPLRKK